MYVCNFCCEPKNEREYYVIFICIRRAFNSISMGIQDWLENVVAFTGTAYHVNSKARICGDTSFLYSNYKNRWEEKNALYLYIYTYILMIIFLLSWCTFENIRLSTVYHSAIHLEPNQEFTHKFPSKKFHRVEIFITGFVPLLNFMDCKNSREKKRREEMIGFSSPYDFLHNRVYIPCAFHLFGINATLLKSENKGHEMCSRARHNTNYIMRPIIHTAIFFNSSQLVLLIIGQFIVNSHTTTL